MKSKALPNDHYHIDQALDTSTGSCALPDYEKQCASLTLITNDNGWIKAEWIFGPLPAGIDQGSIEDQEAQVPQAFEVTLPDYPSIPSLQFGSTPASHAVDLMPTDMEVRAIGPYNQNVAAQGESLLNPYRAVVYYRHWEDEDGVTHPPLVRIDNDLDPEHQPPGEFRVEYFVDSGGVSPTPMRTGREIADLELPLSDYSATNPTDSSAGYWHLDCATGGKNIYLQAVHFSPWTTESSRILHYNLITNTSPTPCVNQGELWMVDALTGVTIDRMPFTPDRFKLRAITSDGRIDDIVVKLVSYDSLGNPIDQGAYATGPDPYTIEVTLTYNSLLGLHESGEIESLFYDPGAGASSLDSTGSEINLLSNGLTIMQFFRDREGWSLFQTSGIGVGEEGCWISFMTGREVDSPALTFDKIMGRTGDPDDKIYLKLDLPHGETITPPGNYYISYCVRAPESYYGPCDSENNFKLTLQPSESSSTLSVYRGEFEVSTIWQNTIDSDLEYTIFDTSDWEDGRSLSRRIREGGGTQAKKSGEAIYNIGKIEGRYELCDLPTRPCDNLSGLIDQLENRDRIEEDEEFEIPYLDKTLVQTGGVKLLLAYLGNPNGILLDKALIPDQADIIYISTHGYKSGHFALRYDQLGDKIDFLWPEEDLINDEWSTDVDIVIFSACNELSLCADSGDPNIVNYDPRCAVDCGSGSAYNPAHPPGDPNCICTSCGSEGVDYWGGQRWRDLRKIVTLPDGSTVRRGPKLFLGYYETAPYGREYTPNTDTRIINKLMINLKGNYSIDDSNIDNWIQAWMDANRNPSGGVTQQVAAIDARDPNNMVYWAMVYDFDRTRWVVETIYYDLDPQK